MSASGSLTTVTTSAAVRVRPKEKVLCVLTVAGGETFDGIVALQVSRNGGQTWEDMVVAGVTQRFDGTSVTITAGEVTSVTFTNEQLSRAQVRAAMLDAGEADGVSFALTEQSDEVLETILRDSLNRPVVQVIEGGGLRVVGKLEVGGAVEAESTVDITGALGVTGALTPTGGVAALGNVTEKVAEVTISAADIIATGAGKFGHAEGYPLVPAAEIGADQAAELVSALVVNDRDTAAYTDGGNVTINKSGGGAAVTGLVANTAFLGAATDTVHLFLPLAAAANVLTAGAGLHLVAAAAFTNPGTAAGVVRVRIRYRIHELALA